MYLTAFEITSQCCSGATVNFIHKILEHTYVSKVLKWSITIINYLSIYVSKKKIRKIKLDNNFKGKFLAGARYISSHARSPSLNLY